MTIYAASLSFGAFIGVSPFSFRALFAQLLSEIINSVKLFSYTASYRIERRCNRREADVASWSAYLSSPG